MALIKCKECGREVSESAPTCPHCGVKNPGKRPPRLTAGAGCLLIFVLLVIVGMLSSIGSDDAPTQSAAPPPAVPYTVSEQWSIPNGGYGKVIVIDSALRTNQGMAALGEQLRYDARNDRNSFIQIFASARAAQLRKKVLDEKATAAENRLFDRNMLGSYTKNSNTGFHALEYSLGGVQGSSRSLKYPAP